MLSILNLVLAELLPGITATLSNLETALSLGPR